MPRKYLYLTLFLLVLSLISPRGGQAQETAAAGLLASRVMADMMRFGPEVKITEPITSDALLVGGSVEISSPVAGDLLLAGGEVAVKDEVAGDVRVLAGKITLDAKISGNVTLLGGEVVFGKGSNIGGNVFIISGAALLDGRINGSVIGRTYDGRNFRVSHTAQINGSISYRARTENTNLGQNTARGGVSFEPIQEPEIAGKIAGFFGLLSLFGLLVVGLFFVSLAPKTLRRLVDNSIARPGKDLLWGIIMLLGAPLLILFLALTLIGLPLAVILLMGYVLVIYLAAVFSGLSLGMFLARLAKGREFSERTSLLWLMVVGVAVLWSLCRLPVVGPFIQLLSIIWGLGLIVRLKWQVLRKIESNN